MESADAIAGLLDSLSISKPTKHSVSVHLHPSCYLHAFQRTMLVGKKGQVKRIPDNGLVELPCRVKSVYLGIAMAQARLGLEQFKIVHHANHLELEKAVASLSAVHPLEYTRELYRWIAESSQKHLLGLSEIPAPYPQGDLYLSHGSGLAISASLSAACEAVDSLFSEGSPSKAFVACRPPGHHCSDTQPSGFCFVNNALVAAAHARSRYKAIVWDWNEKQRMEEAKDSSDPNYLGIAGEGHTFYGSLHDIESYPCEDGDPSLVSDASISIQAHGQYIHNVHLPEPSASQVKHDLDNAFYKFYHSDLGVKSLFTRAREFCRKVQAQSNNTLIIISSGFDASEFEYPSMSRHGKRVPTSFFSQFARDLSQFAEEFSSGKVLSVLEGGYSDRALSSGVLALLTGLSAVQGSSTQPPSSAITSEASLHDEWWTVPELTKVEKAISKNRRPGVKAPLEEQWIQDTVTNFNHLLSTIEPPRVEKSEALSVDSNSGRPRRERKPTPTTTPSNSSPIKKPLSSSKSPIKSKVKTPMSSPSLKVALPVPPPPIILSPKTSEVVSLVMTSSSQILQISPDEGKPEGFVPFLSDPAQKEHDLPLTLLQSLQIGDDGIKMPFNIPINPTDPIMSIKSPEPIFAVTSIIPPSAPVSEDKPKVMMKFRNLSSSLYNPPPT